MTDLEKTIDSAENTEATTSGAGDDFSLDFSDSLPQETPQIKPDLSEVSSPSEDISSSNLNEDISTPDLTKDSPSPNLSEESSLSNTSENISSTVNEDFSSPDLSEDAHSPDLSEDVHSPDLSEDAPSVNLADNENTVPNASDENAQPDLTNYQQETINNEITLWETKNEWSNATSPEETNNSLINTVNTPLEQPSLLEQSQTNENPLAENPLAEKITDSDSQNQEKNKISPKEKLAQLVKLHESKAQKSWFIRWIFSGIALTAVIVLAWFIFAKDQILDLINKIDGNNQQLSANIVDIINTTEENIPENEDINMNVDEEINDEEIDIENEENNLENEFINEEFIDDDIYDDNIISDEDTDDTKDYLEDYLLIEEDEDIQMEDTEDLSYTITHVDSVEDANWVLPSHCSNLTCYGEEKEFTPCTVFRQSENLDENANRIGKNWVCKYKDSSELVYVEFN